MTDLFGWSGTGTPTPGQLGDTNFAYGPAAALHAAAYTALNTILNPDDDGTIPIALGSFGEVVRWPCATFIIRDRPRRLYGGNMSQLVLQISIFSAQPGAGEVLSLADAVAALDGQRLEVAGASTTAARLRDRVVNSIQDGPTKRWQAVLFIEFEAALQGEDSPTIES